jgi:hypothetical protein
VAGDLAKDAVERAEPPGMPGLQADLGPDGVQDPEPGSVPSEASASSAEMGGSPCAVMPASLISFLPANQLGQVPRWPRPDRGQA